MAELIPIEYRLRAAQRELASQWLRRGVLVAIAAAACLIYTFGWFRQRSTEHDKLAAEFKEKSTLITRSDELRSRRQNLANRMQKIQELMDDKVLLSLLKNISEGFSGKDCLEFVSIDARAQDAAPAPDKPAPDPHYVVRITGITQSSGTLAELMTRLGQRGNPPINVVLESSHREPLLDGQVMRFQIVCDKPDPKGT
jgi:Tfp pilus assembly protein PilN